MSLLGSYKRCCCGTPACSPTWSPIGLTQDDLYFSWVSNADHGPGSIALSYYENTNWKGWWGLLSCSPPSKAGVSPTVRSSMTGACAAICGGSTFNFLVMLTCNDFSTYPYSTATYQVPQGLNPATACHLDPGSIVLPASGPPRLTWGADANGCPSGSMICTTPTTILTFGASTSSPLSIACSFSAPLQKNGGGTYPGYTFDYSGAITQ